MCDIQTRHAKGQRTNGHLGESRLLELLGKGIPVWEGLHARRQALAFVYDKDLVSSLFEQAPERYAERNGGYSRVTTEIQRRRGDNSEMATIELV